MKVSSLLGAIVISAAFLSLAPLTHAQSSRVWVSGGGDETAAGSRTAPVKTFATAISKASARGEVDILDAGSFGQVTITKSITIDGLGSMAAIGFTSANGITITAADDDVVTLRNLNIGGGGTGTYGIKINSAGVVRIENCVIGYGTTNVIHFAPTTTNAMLFIKNTHLYGAGGAGIAVNPNANGRVVVENCQIEQCGTGISALNTSTIAVRDSVITLNTGAGIDASAATVNILVENSSITVNGIGVQSSGVVTLSDVTVAGNTGAGLTNLASGAIKTYHNNRITGNNPDGNPTGSLPLR